MNYLGAQNNQNLNGEWSRCSQLSRCSATWSLEMMSVAFSRWEQCLFRLSNPGCPVCSPTQGGCFLTKGVVFQPLFVSQPHFRTYEHQPSRQPDKQADAWPQVGSWSAMTGYGLAFPLNSKHKAKFNEKLLEYRFNHDDDNDNPLVYEL